MRIEFLGSRINSKAFERAQLSNDNLVFDAPSQCSTLDGQHSILNTTSTSPLRPTASAVPERMARAVSELGIEDKSQLSQKLFMMIEGVPPSNLNTLTLNSACTVVDCCSKSHNVICTPDSCLSMATELPPVLHLQKHPAALNLPDGISCVITPYPEPLEISESIEPYPLANISSTFIPISIQKTRKDSAHEVLKKLAEGTKLGKADELENKNSKYKDYKELSNLFLSLPESKAPVSEKVEGRKPEESYLVGTTDKNPDDADLWSQASFGAAFPMQHEVSQRIVPRNY